MKIIDKQAYPLLVGQKESNEAQMKSFFNVLVATVVRSRVTMTATFLSAKSLGDYSEEEIHQIDEELTLYLKKQIRQTDLLFKLSTPLNWCILLSSSREEETVAFLNRLFSTMQESSYFANIATNLTMSASVAEIGNSKVVYEDLIEKGTTGLLMAEKKGAWNIVYLNDFKEKDFDKVKVSILEENEIFLNILSASLEGLALEHFKLEIKTFKDGHEFLESEFFHSSHTHIVIMNDILPRKNGLEVLQTLRKLPNHKKFIIFMMTKRKSENDMLYAYEKGVDEYLIKPFNLRLFEAQIKRTFERLWS